MSSAGDLMAVVARRLCCVMWAGLALIAGLAGAARAQEANVFGSSTRGGTAGLVGIFYDLKQTQQRQPVPGNGKDYAKFIDEFIVAGFDEALFNRFFRAGLPLYTTQVATGRMNAEAAPKAFGVEDVVKPRAWVVHYKGQVAPPVDGTYRFVGAADDMLVVAINRRVVLVGNLPSTAFPVLGWKPPADPGPKVAANSGAKYGEWIELQADKPVDIDILIGERPGGIFHSVVLYEKKGETYPRTAKGEIVLPLFQVAALPMNEKNFLTDRPPWRCFERAAARANALPPGARFAHNNPMARPDTQTRIAVEMIRKRLQHGDHALGGLPGERQLATELGLSRPTVRKALGQLTEEGLLSRGATGRVQVAESADGSARRPLIAFLHTGNIRGENALWRDGVYAAAEKRGAVVRSFGYEHYGDAVFSKALDGFDGVFLLQFTDEKITPTLLKRIQSARARVVVLDQDETALGLRSVIVFPFSAGDKLLEHLRSLGHRRIDCLNIHPHNPVIEARIAGWRGFIESNGLAGELMSAPVDGTLGAAYKLMSARLKAGKPVAPAVYGVTVHAAIGAMRALHEHGLRIGRDVSVCAVNDEGLGPYLVPSLTSLQTPPRDRYLLKAVDWMTGRGEWKKPSLVQPKDAPLFVGESTGPAPK